jgi:CHASE2 domain-containing sensor protein
MAVLPTWLRRAALEKQGGNSIMHLKRRVGVLFLVLLLILPVVGLNAANSPQLIDLSTVKCTQKDSTYNAENKNITSVDINGTSVNLANEGLEIDWSSLKRDGNKVSSVHDAGTYTVTVKAKSGSKRYKGQTTLTFKVNKSTKAQIAKSDKKKIQNRKYTVNKSGKKKASLKLRYTLIKSTSTKGITYKLTGKNAKYFSINKKGVITLKKGAKVKTGKTYKVTVKTVRKESKDYKKKDSKPITIKIKIAK